MDEIDPFECVLGHKAEICPSHEVTPEIMVVDTFKTYHAELKKHLAYLISLMEI